MNTRLPVLLDNLRVAAPCRADWDEMAGDERVRFCGRCDKNVYNLSAMSRNDAEALVREREGVVCVRFFQRQDGTVITSDCPVGLHKRRLRARAWAAVTSAAAAIALFLGLLSGRARADLTLKDGKKDAAPPPVAMMGGPAAPPHVEHVLMGKPMMPPPPKKKIK